MSLDNNDPTTLAAELVALGPRLAELKAEPATLPLRPPASPAAAKHIADNLALNTHQDPPGSAIGEHALLSILEDASLGFWDWNIPSGTECWSPAAKRMLGYGPSELPNSSAEWSHLVLESDRPQLQAAFEQHVQSQGRELYAAEIRMRHKDGSTIWVRRVGRVIEWANRSPIRMVGLHIDISQGKRAEQALHESGSRQKVNEAMFLEAQKIALIGSWEFDLKTGEARWSRQAYVNYGTDPETFVPSFNAFRSFVHPEDRERIEDTVRMLRQTGNPVDLEFRIIIADGSTRFLRSRGEVTRFDPDGSPRIMTGIEQDITAHKRAEQECAESRILLQNFLDSSNTLAFAFDLQGRFILTNRGLERLLGAAPGSLLGRMRTEAFPDMPAEVAAEHRRNDLIALTSDRPIEFNERNIEADGEHIYQTVKFPLRGSAGSVMGIGGIATDVTARLRAKAALAASEARFRAIYEHGPFGIAIGDLQGRLVLANPSFCELLGFTEQELLQKNFRDFTFDEDLPLENRFVNEMLAGVRSHYEIEKRYLTKDGRKIWVNLTTSVLRDACGAPEFGMAMAQSISERKEAEQEKARLLELLHQSKKMEALGTLAGGVAHDFNNILGGLMGGLSFLELELGEASPLVADIESMKSLIERGAQLTRQLLGFARRGKYDAQPLDLGRVVRETSEMFGRTRRDISIRFDIESSLPPVLMDHAQLEQMLLNLLLNAGQAMPAGGQLLLRAERVALVGDEARRLGVEPGLFVRLAVADNGIGMDAATQERIFEPFFTTKAVGQGSGLGLASVWGIVENHRGSIRVQSSPGKGATFTILLPAVEATVTVDKSAAKLNFSGEGIALVIDDEEMLRTGLARLLVRLGYKTLVASGGRAAIELVRAHRDNIAFVLLDLTMPEMSGRATYEAIYKIAPELKVLLMSGFAAEGEATELLARGCKGFIQKPFTLSALIEKIHSSLS